MELQRLTEIRQGLSFGPTLAGHIDLEDLAPWDFAPDEARLSLRLSALDSTVDTTAASGHHAFQRTKVGRGRRMTRKTRCFALAALCSFAARGEAQEARPSAALGYVREPRPEAADERRERLRRVAERRAGPIIMVHRGAAAFAVRGTAVLECLDHPSPERTAALREAAPWAMDLLP